MNTVIAPSPVTEWTSAQRQALYEQAQRDAAALRRAAMADFAASIGRGLRRIAQWTAATIAGAVERSPRRSTDRRAAACPR